MGLGSWDEGLGSTELGLGLRASVLRTGGVPSLEIQTYFEVPET